MNERKRIKKAKRNKKNTKARNKWANSKVKREDKLDFDQRKAYGQFRD